MIQIRKGVFETNSSSSHSIVLMKKDKPAEELVDAGWRVKDGEMNFTYGYELEFGRSPFALLTTWSERLAYAIAYYGDSKLKEIEEICRKRVKDFDHFKFGTDRWSNMEDHGYVDHQSMGILDAALKKYNVSLEEFIFNDKFIVVIDGDEYCVFNTLIDTDMFNKDSVEDITSASYGLDNGYWRDNEEEE